MGDVPPIELIRSTFAEQFGHGGVTLPAYLAEEESAVIHRKGWTITYRLRSSGGTPCLVYLASHRLGSTSLHEITAQGDHRELADEQEWHRVDVPTAHE